MPGYPSNSQLPAQHLTRITQSTERADDDAMTTELHSSRASPRSHIPLPFQFSRVLRPCQPSLFVHHAPLAARGRFAHSWQSNTNRCRSGMALCCRQQVKCSCFVPNGMHDQHQTIRQMDIQASEICWRLNKARLWVTFSLGIGYQYHCHWQCCPNPIWYHHVYVAGCWLLT